MLRKFLNKFILKEYPGILSLKNWYYLRYYIWSESRLVMEGSKTVYSGEDHPSLVFLSEDRTHLLLIYNGQFKVVNNKKHPLQEIAPSTLKDLIEKENSYFNIDPDEKMSTRKTNPLVLKFTFFLMKLDIRRGVVPKSESQSKVKRYQRIPKFDTRNPNIKRDANSQT